MYRSIYNQMAEDTGAAIRENERLAFERCITLLKRAEAHGRGSRESVEALVFVNRLWTILLEDLSHPENGLPESLRAGLISVGIWILRQTERIRQGEADGFSSLIEVSQTISNGLRQV